MERVLPLQILANVFWIIVGVVITRILDKPIERYQKRFLFWLRRFIARFRISDVMPIEQDIFRLGKWSARWIVVEGSSTDPYTPNNVICQLDPSPLTLSQDRLAKKQEIESTQTQLEISKGRRDYHNGPTVALQGIGRGQIGTAEDPLLILKLRPSDYYSFLATAISLDEVITLSNGKKVSVREKYLQNLDFNTPLPEFASALSVNLSFITSDGYVVVSKRAVEGIGGYQGHIAPAINECINSVIDRSVSGTISLLATVQRGASSELNVEVEEDEVVFFTVGVDPRWYFWGVTGLIRSKKFSKADLLSRRSLGSKEHWEVNDLFFLPHNPFEIAKFMRNISKTERWQPISIVCVVQTLISEFGIKAVEQALRKYPPISQ